MANIEALTVVDSLTVQCHLGASAPSSLVRRALYNLPSPLWQLRIVAPSSPEFFNEGCKSSGFLTDLRALTEALQEEEGVVLTSLLSRVMVPLTADPCETCKPGYVDLFKELEELAEARECELERAPLERAELGDWETYLDEW